MVKYFKKPTSDEGDAWPQDKKGIPNLLSAEQILSLYKKYTKNDHPNLYPYVVAQETALGTMKYFKKILNE